MKKVLTVTMDEVSATMLPARQICRAGSMVADTVHRDGQNFFHR